MFGLNRPATYLILVWRQHRRGRDEHSSTVEYTVLSRNQTINLANHDSVWTRLFQVGDSVRWTFDPRRVYALSAEG
ncbi:MAG: hypothetical protein KatS3mg053_1173 [Candidatus Roseilinea sp.]|nr:MAG: hypothetical protein KatS3mg053_1173 [Candidatus Roseilinea sp.]